MFPIPTISNTTIPKSNTIIRYLRNKSKSEVTVGGSTNILYNPSPFFYTEGYNAIRMISSGAYLQVGTGFVPPAFVINDNTNFIIESYVYLTGTTTQMLIGNLVNSEGSGSYWLTLNNAYQVPSQISLDGYSTTGAVQRFRFGTTTTTTTTLPTDVWFKFKLERVGTLLSCYINDVPIGSSLSMPHGFRNTSGNAYRIGISADNTYQLLGAIDSFSISTT